MKGEGQETFRRTRYYLFCQKNLFESNSKLSGSGREVVSPMLPCALIASLSAVIEGGIVWKWRNGFTKRSSLCQAALAWTQPKSLVRRHTVIVIITKAQQKERQHSSWRALAQG
ncbi:hypothetical protein NQD34_008836 [Periophthalmus magnuspinnatus]|nr:hypothetical protein NQD34_008836 [Periophthalmus magnuspinnatus]